MRYFNSHLVGLDNRHATGCLATERWSYVYKYFEKEEQSFFVKALVLGKIVVDFLLKAASYIYGVLVVSFIILLVVSISILYSVGPTRK